MLLLLHTFGLYFGGPIVQYSCAVNTRTCSIHFVIACLCQRRGGTFYNHELLSVCQTKGGESGSIHVLLAGLMVVL